VPDTPRSYYAPSIPQTVGVSFGEFMPPEYSGEPFDIVVACDLGRAIYGFRDGAVAWSKHFPASWPRALDVFEGLMFYGDGTNIVVCNPQTGFVHRTYPMPAVVNAIKVTRFGSVVYVTVCFDINGANSVRVYRWQDFALSQFFSNSHVAKHPRGAYCYAGWVFVADTFGHRVYAVDMASGAMRNSTPVYYPNTIEPVSSDKVRICAEHENRVFIWDYYPSDTREMELSAPVLPYSDITVTRDQIIAQEWRTATGDHSPQKSACAMEYAGPVTLYSPNSATMTPHGLLVADTDNHRVILVRNGAIVASISGFNNPTTAVMS